MSYHRRRRRRGSGIDTTLLLAVVVFVGGGLATLSSYQFAFGLEGVAQFATITLAVAVPLVIVYALVVRYFQKKRREEEYRMHQALQDMREMQPYDFEKYVAWIFEKMGYHAQVTQASGDHGLDVILKKDGKLYGVQCKRYAEGNNIGEPELRDFYGTLTASHMLAGFFVTTSDFTPPAYAWIKGKPITLINGERLIEMVGDF